MGPCLTRRRARFSPACVCRSLSPQRIMTARACAYHATSGGNGGISKSHTTRIKALPSHIDRESSPQFSLLSIYAVQAALPLDIIIPASTQCLAILEMHTSVFLVIISLPSVLTQTRPSSITPPPTSSPSGVPAAFIGYSWVSGLGACWCPLKWPFFAMTYAEM